MEQMLLVIQLLLAAALIAVVLLQRSDSDGFGLGSGSNSNFLSGRASANLMTRTTAILAALFIINSLILSIVASNRGAESIVDTVTKKEAPSVPAEPVAAKVPAAPQVPAATPEGTKTPAAEAATAPAAATPALAPAVPIAEPHPKVDGALQEKPSTAAPAVDHSAVKPVDPNAPVSNKEQ